MHDDERFEPDDESPYGDDSDDELEQWEDWPECPNCGERRRAVCPICETSGADFPLAEWIPTAPLIQLGGVDGDDDVIGSPPLMLMCTTCDEAFAPNFYDQCEHCGYDFEVGKVIVSPELESEELNVRMLVVTAVLVVVTVALVGYFGFVLR